VNSLMKNSNEYWYIGSTIAKSAITKYKTDPLVATFRYYSLASKIDFLVSSDLSIRSEIVIEVDLLLSKVSTKSSYSNKFSASEIILKTLFSKSIS